MLRTNLSTRPFYNVRGVRALLALVAAAALALTVFNVAGLLTLTGRQRTLAAEATAAESQAREFRAEAGRLRAALDPARIEAVQLSAREANQLIDRRTFSWTELFNQFEATLPPDVRIASVTPQIDPAGHVVLSMDIYSRGVRDLDLFIRQLEGTGAFRSVLTRQEEMQAGGLLRSSVQGYYGASAAVPSAASEPDVDGDQHETPRDGAPEGDGQ